MMACMKILLTLSSLCMVTLVYEEKIWHNITKDKALNIVGIDEMISPII